MEENNMTIENEVTVNTEADEIDVENSTDLVATDDNSEGGIGGLEVAIGGLAVVGGVFLVKKSVDGVKWCYGKAKGAIESFKEKRAEKKAAKAGEDKDPIDVEATVTDVEEDSTKETSDEKNEK